MRHKVGDWVYRFIGNFHSPFLCEVVGFAEENVGFFTKKMEPRYLLRIPKQEWQIYGSDNIYSHNYCTKTQSELFSR